jgi:glycosyltransferase involved in cell wall biosynthesis
VNRQLTILAPVRYLWRFNSPKRSRHQIHFRTFLPLNYISKKIEGVTLFNPFPPKRFDLIHAFNRIPISELPFLIGFESHLPRGFGIEKSAFFRAMTERLVSQKCRAIVAISQYAQRQFLRVHEGSKYFDELRAKLHVRLPNIVIDPAEDAFRGAIQEPIRILFVGNHFGRKGGCVTLRMAELAAERKLPLRFDIVSKFEVGHSSWTDPLDQAYFDRYRKLLTLPNVCYHGWLPNNAVLKLIREANFAVLTTFSDSFGFSAIEAMANYTPVIATTQGALPEFIEHEKNGVLVPLPTDEFGEWIRINDDRSTARFAAVHQDEIERLSHAALDSVTRLTASRKAYEALRRNARATAVELFSSNDADQYWDDMYERAIEGYAPTGIRSLADRVIANSASSALRHW